MTRAYICDRCGTILPAESDAEIHPIWLRNPAMYRDGIESDFDLCCSCFDLFKNEYMKNLIEEGSE